MVFSIPAIVSIDSLMENIRVEKLETHLAAPHYWSRLLLTKNEEQELSMKTVSFRASGGSTSVDGGWNHVQWRQTNRSPPRSGRAVAGNAVQGERGGCRALEEEEERKERKRKKRWF
ncbi:hypothetical protein JCGZ_00137 [Jatropha curcas]|uniref:Uncharacterized protein n=1 Tax=Jatropha curcas TaxID=180498 RepID=A0A067JUZ4_JATCU|nr:hypothetical protein JCGZ_00137 [Jatropha curcas]